MHHPHWIRKQARHLAAIALCLAAFPPTALAQTSEQMMDGATGRMKVNMARDCEKARADEARATADAERFPARTVAFMSCTCMPGELEKMRAEARAGRFGPTLTLEVFQARLKTGLQTCGAGAARILIPALCNSGSVDVGRAERGPFCGCLAEGLNAADDDALGKEILGGHFASFNGRRPGESVPPELQSGPMQKALDSCQARFDPGAAKK
jgi:hypothetical protein